MKEEIEELISNQLKKREKSIRNRNAIGVFLRLFPILNALKEVLTGAKKELEIERQKLTLEKIIDLIIAIDDKLSGKSIEKVDEGLKILIKNVVSDGNIVGLKGKTSNRNLRKVFEKPLSVTIDNARAKRNVTGVDLGVDEEMPIKEKVKIKTNNGMVEINPKLGEVTLGKKSKKTEQGSGNPQ